MGGVNGTGGIRRPAVLAVCGKGGVGKTVLSVLLARSFLASGTRPLLLVDADPAGGLASAMGESAVRTLAGVREDLIRAARRRGPGESTGHLRMADPLDSLVLEALVERPGYALLAMGHSTEKGCFCPANALLRGALHLLAEAFALVLIDAEAGIEQIHREVTREVTCAIGIADGSARSARTLGLIAARLGADRVKVVVNRSGGPEMADRGPDLPPDLEVLGAIPEDPLVREFDRLGRPLWDLPETSPALDAGRAIAAKLACLPESAVPVPEARGAQRG